MLGWLPQHWLVIQHRGLKTADLEQSLPAAIWQSLHDTAKFWDREVRGK
jgi:hypothetical protein